MRLPTGLPHDQHRMPPVPDFGGGGDAFRAEHNLNPIPAEDPIAIVVNNLPMDNPLFQLLGILPGLNALDISPQVDGKLWKEVLYTPENSQFDYGARHGMQVKVHYWGSLVNGNIFDYNDETDPPFTFTLGEEMVIPGWERGVIGMKRGEKIKLICHSDFGYGERTTDEDVPPNSTLIFEIHMVEYQPEDLTKNKTGHILRYNVKVGESKYLNPNHGSMVEVLIRGKCKATEKDVYPSRTEKFRLGEGCDHGIPYGVEKALYKFRAGEASILIIKGSKYTISADECVKYGVSPDNPLEFYVELLANENAKEPWQLEGPEKLQISRNLKQLGNAQFAKTNYKAAFKNYRLIIDHLKAEALLIGDEEDERKRLLHAAYLNMAICHLKMNKPTAAIRDCDDAVALDSTNPKAFFRRGLAYLEVNMPDPAKLDFEKVLKLEPANSAASQKVLICDKQIKLNLRTEKNIYSKMFSTAATSSKPEAPLPGGMENVTEWKEQKPSDTNGTNTS